MEDVREIRGHPQPHRRHRSALHQEFGQRRQTFAHLAQRRQIGRHHGGEEGAAYTAISQNPPRLQRDPQEQILRDSRVDQA